MRNIPFPLWFFLYCPYSSRVVSAFYNCMDRSKERGSIVPFLPFDLEIGSEIKQDLTEHWILPHVSSKLSLHIKDHYIKANALGLWQILGGFMYTAYHLFYFFKTVKLLWSSSLNYPEGRKRTYVLLRLLYLAFYIFCCLAQKSNWIAYRCQGI